MAEERPPVSVTLSVPIGPETLNRQLQAAAHKFRGEFDIPNYRLTFAVPAGGEVSVPFPLAPKWVCTRRSPLHFDSDYYDKDLTVDVYCDNKLVNPSPLRLTAPFDVDFGIYYVKKKRVDITITNDTDTDANVTFQVIPNLIRESMYREWYKPLIDKAYDMLTKFAEAPEVPPIEVTR